MFSLIPEDPKAVMPFAKTLLRLSGFRQNTEQLGKQIYVNMFIFFAIIFIPKVCFPYPDTEALVRGLSELIFFANMFGGLYCFFFHHHALRDLLNSIDQFVTYVYPTTHQPDSKSERMLITLNRKINTISKVYISVRSVAAFMYWLIPCIITYHSMYKAAANGSIDSFQSIPNIEESFYWIDNRNSVFGYAFFSVFALVVCIYAVLNHGAKLLTIAPTIKYISTLLQLVSIRLDELRHVAPDKIEEELKTVVQMHQIAIRCVDLLNQTLSFVMGLQLALCTLTWCFTLLYILIVGFDVTAMMGLIIMINMTPEMFGYCLFCTELTTSGINIARQSYEFCWEDHRPEAQKMIMMIIARAQNPLYITACGLVPVDLELFAKVVKTSYSVLLVLRDFV